jgi:hypothetical protein
MKQRVELVFFNKEGSIDLTRDWLNYLLVLPRGEILKIGDPVIGINGETRIESSREGDFFDSVIYTLQDGSNMSSPRKVIAKGEEIDLSRIKKEKDQKGPFYIEIEAGRICRKSGKILVFT